MTGFELAQRYVGIREISGVKNHPLVSWWFSLCAGYGLETPDEVPWCSAFVNGIAWELRLPRSKSAAARSWLTVGRVVDVIDAQTGYDIVVLKRGNSPTAGHVGWFAGTDSNRVHVLGGNQGNSVSVVSFPAIDLLGIRRLA